MHILVFVQQLFGQLILSSQSEQLFFRVLLQKHSPFFFLSIPSWQDIVVGAPQYFDRSGDIGGAVYVYMNRQGKWAGVKPLRLNGTTDSMFGLAVENVGDINQDGYPGKWKTITKKSEIVWPMPDLQHPILPFDCMLQKEQE